MNRILIAALLLNALFALATKSLHAQEAARILQKSEIYRNPGNSFVLRLSIENYENSLLKQKGRYEVYVKGLENSLVRFLNPSQKGQFLLMKGDNLWIYLPGTRKPIRITPLQRLMGDASNGDVARTNFTADYQPNLIGEALVNEQPCYQLELTAKRKGATYHRILYFINKDNFRPQKAEFFLVSGKLFKTAIFSGYRKFGDKTLVSEMTLIDRLRPGRKTIMRYESYRPEALPDKYFNKNYLRNLNF